MDVDSNETPTSALSMEHLTQLEELSQINSKRSRDEAHLTFAENVGDLIESRESLEKEIDEIKARYGLQKQKIRRNRTYDSNTKSFLLALVSSVYEAEELGRKPEYLENIRRAINKMLTTETTTLTREKVEDAKSRVPISRVLEALDIRIKSRAGRKTYAYSPFRRERTASFVTYDNDNTYHCFATNSSGDVIKLVMKVKNIGFAQAVDYINKL